MPGGGAGCAVERQEDALVLAGRDPRALVDDEHADAVADVARSHRHRALARSSARRSRARSRTPARAARGRPAGAACSGSTESLNTTASPLACSIASCSTSSIEYHTERGSARPACSTDRSSSFSISRHSRVPASSTCSRTSPTFSRVGCSASSAVAAIRIARQRRAQIMRDGAQHGRLELVAAAQRGGLDDLGLQLGAVQRGARGSTRARGTTRSAMRVALGAGERAGQQSARRSAAPPLCSANTSAPRSSLVWFAARCSPSARRSPRPGVSEASRERLLELRAAEQQLRHLGREIGLLAARARASRLRARASSATSPVAIATTTNASSATQSLSSARVKRPPGGR